MTHAVFTAQFAGWRFYGDGTELGASPFGGAAEDANVTVNVDGGDVQIQIRVMVQEIGDGSESGATTDDWQLQYQKNGSGRDDITAASTDIQADTGSALTDGNATTNRVTDGVADGNGSFVAGEQEAGDGEVEDHQLTADNFSEHVFALLVIADDVANGDTFDLRLTLNGGNPGMNNAVAPRITIEKAGDSVYPADVPPPTFKVKANRELQQPFFPPEYPVTPPPPVSVVAETPALTANRTAFKRILQTLELNEYPVTPAPPVSVVAETPALKANLIEYRRTLRVLPEIDEYPATPQPAQPMSAFTPPLKVIISRFERELQKLPQLDQFAETPPGFFDGQWPASLTLRPLEISAERVSQDVLNPHVYPPTPLGFFDGFYPGSARVESFRISFDRRRQTLELNEYPAPPVSAAPVVAFQRPPQFTWQFKRTVQGVELDEYPETPAVATPISAFERALVALVAEFERTLQALPIPAEYPIAAVPVVVLPVLTANRVRFTRSVQTVIHPEQAPAIPPSIIEMPAMWAAQSVYRRDLHRTIQPTWQPASIIGEDFLDVDTECRWFADCAPVLWTADKSLTLWKADAEQTWSADCD